MVDEEKDSNKMDYDIFNDQQDNGAEEEVKEYYNGRDNEILTILSDVVSCKYSETAKQNITEFLEKNIANFKVWNFRDFYLEHLSQGFYGTVFKATHKPTRDVLVLKVLKDTFNDDMQKEMFLEEIRLLNKLCHANVLKCKGITFINEKICYLSEYVAGDSLEMLIARQINDPLSWDVFLHICLDIAKGMAYLHTQYIIHRDLTSRNVVTRQIGGKFYEAIIIDFGLSYEKPDSGSEEEDDCPVGPIGSPYHLAPELFKEKPCSFKTDVFSYGIILCEIIAGCPGADPDELPRTEEFGLNVEEFSAMAFDDCPTEFLNVAVTCCQLNPCLRPNFKDIVKMIDIILDLQNDMNDETDNLIIEESLICSCHRKKRNLSQKIDYIFEETYDRVGVIQRKGSRKLVKETFRRCSLCGGRSIAINTNTDQNENRPDSINKNISLVTDDNVSNKIDNEDNLHIQDSFEENKSSLTPSSPIIYLQEPQKVSRYESKPIKCEESPRYSTLEKMRKFPAGVLLNQDKLYLTNKTNQLVYSTPGVLPRFFNNILRRRKNYPSDPSLVNDDVSPRKSLKKLFHRKGQFNLKSPTTFGSSTEETFIQRCRTFPSIDKTINKPRRSSEPNTLDVVEKESCDNYSDAESKINENIEVTPLSIKTEHRRSRSFLDLLLGRRKFNLSPIT